MNKLSFTLLSLMLCINVYAQGNSANVPGKQKGPGQSAKQFAPGQEKGAGQSAKQFAPGQEKGAGQSAKPFAPGQQNKNGITPMNADGQGNKGNHGKGKQ
jgi:hypothetical protein